MGIDKRIKGNTGCEEWRSVLCVIGVLVQSIICRYSVNNVNKLFVYMLYISIVKHVAPFIYLMFNMGI